MLHILPIRTVRAAIGAVLLTFIAAACSDVPSGPRQPAPAPYQDQALAAPGDRGIMEAGLPALLPGEKRQRRTLRGADGEQMTMESIIGTDGLPRVSIISRGGDVVMRVANEHRDGALVRQVALMRGAGGVVRTFDSRNVSSAQLAAARAQLRDQAVQMTRAQAGRILRLEEDAGVCDAEVKAANIATWQYVAAGSAVIAAAATGNIFATASAYSVFLTAYANYETKQSDLDKCVTAAGKKPMDEY